MGRRLLPAFFILVVFISSGAAQEPQHGSWAQLSDLQKGEMYLLRQKTDEAIRLFREFWEKNPDSNYAVRGLVRGYHAKNNLADGQAYLKDYITAHSDSSPAHYGMGFLLYLKNNHEEAQKYLKDALRFDPRNALALNALGASLIEVKKPEEAVDKVRQALTLHPQELMFYRNLKRIYDVQGKPEAFREEFDSLWSSGNKSVARNYGLVMAQTLRQESFKAYVDGDKKVTIQKMRSMLEIYQKIEHMPGVVAGHFSLGLLYEEEGDSERAKVQFQKVLDINPGHIQARKKIQEYSHKNN